MLARNVTSLWLIIVNAATSKTEIKQTSDVSTVLFLWSWHRSACSSSSSSLSGSRVKHIVFAYDINLQQDDYNDHKHVVQRCVYRIVEGNCDSVLVIVIASIIDEGSIFAVRWTARLKLRWQWSLSTWRRQRRDAPSKRNVKQQMHSFGSVECFSVLCKSCVIVTKWDGDIFMVGPLYSLDLVVKRMLNANSLFKFTMPSQTSCWLSRSSISLHRELWKAFQDFFILLIERKHNFVIFPLCSKVNSNRASYIMIPKKALL